MRYFTLLLLICFEFAVLGQNIDFNKYQMLESSGEMPDDFIGSTYEKILDIESNGSNTLNEFDNSEFLFQTRYAIDGLLQSGQVVYGDPITNYINNIAHRLLADEPELREKLRFYTLKSQVPNAFSTDQGIIFTTTGLLSCLVNEAQLAFILAHEISHYTEEHVIESFTWQKENNFSDNWLSEMSKYSRSHETEADLVAIGLFQKAGYSKEAIFTGFDKLARMDSHFANDPLSKGLYSSNFDLPDAYFSNANFPILDRSEYADSLSTHPNIANRKSAIESAINEKGGSWQDALFIESESAFTEIRNIARFELLRSQLLNQDYINALYSADYLIKQIPNSVYLKRAKAKAWIGIGQYAELGWMNKLIQDKDNYSGYVSNLSATFRRMNKAQIVALAVENIYALNKDLNDVESNSMVEFFFSFLKERDEFEFPASIDFVSLNSAEVDSFDISIPAYVYKDSVQFSLEQFALTSVTADAQFVSRYKNAEKLKTMEIEAYNDLRDKGGLYVTSYLSIAPKNREAYKVQYEKLQLEADKMIALSPIAISYSKSGFDYPRSERHEHKLKKAIQFASEESGLEVEILDVKEGQAATQEYNQLALILSSLNQLSEGDFRSFPVDFSEHVALREESGAKHIMFSVVTHTYASKINPYVVMGAAYLVFPFPIVVSNYIPSRILKGNEMNLTVIFYNLEEGRFEAGGAYYYNESITVHGMGSRMYEIFQATMKTPSK